MACILVWIIPTGLLGSFFQKTLSETLSPYLSCIVNSNDYSFCPSSSSFPHSSALAQLGIWDQMIACCGRKFSSIPSPAVISKNVLRCQERCRMLLPLLVWKHWALRVKVLVFVSVAKRGSRETGLKRGTEGTSDKALLFS